MTLRRIAALIVAGSIAACASDPPQTTPNDAALRWPAPPEPARIEYVRAVAQAEDLGIRRGFWQRLGDWVFGAENRRFVRPMSVVEADGVLFVADPGVQGVHRIDPAAGTYDVVRAANAQGLPSPVGLAVDGAAVFVTDSSLRKVFVIEPGARVAAEVPLAGDALQQPTGIAVDPRSRQLIVVDTAAHRLLRFGRDGQLLATLGRRGRDAGEFNYPTMLWRDASGRLYVSDTLNFRVQVLDANGRFLSQFGRAGDGGGDLARHKGLATDSHGHVYVVDALLHAVQIFDASGRLLLGVGAQGQAPGEFWLPAGIYIAPSDTIYVADAYNRRVQVFRYVGEGP